MPERKEIRCYVIPKIANGIIGIMAAFPVIGIVVTIFNGRVFEVAWLLLLIGLFLVLLWLGVRRTYIGVDLEKGTLNGSAFFLPPRRVAIASITHIGAGSMFGSWTVMEVTYQTPGEKKRTGGFGAKETLDKVNFQKILDALMNINPSLQIPAELRKQLGSGNILTDATTTNGATATTTYTYAGNTGSNHAYPVCAQRE